MKKRLLWIIGLVSGTFGAITAILGYLFSSRIMYMKNKDAAFILQREKEAKRFDEVWFEHVNKEEMWVDSPNGYPIKAIYFQPLQTKNTIILCHGVTENKINSMKYVRLFERLGFNSVVYDHRRHGDSGGKTTSYGHYEKYDLQAVMKSLKEKLGEGGIIGVQGESMGAATTLLYAGTLEDEADFYISDCAFSDFSEQLYHLMMKQTPLRTSLAIKLADIFLRMRDGYSVKSISPKEAVTRIEKPVLFIHSIPDDFILPEMTIEMYSLKPGPKKLKLFEEGPHAQSYNMNSDAYERLVAEFLEEFVFVEKTKK
ncbi:alpha/beta hydrolase [Viridibacillus sp. YIM B01967]|uniref:Alpha/beta hydrolase n=1 Tax=Viridibacillus soli TaxID=2798301 RepID=A0ABS1H4E6_9BACL|nr:alpha/beta hydrolase [Viridibacillus soli]MBK3494290.1 alpha/beta hydrolase [Viridibacillus soli]